MGRDYIRGGRGREGRGYRGGQGNGRFQGRRNWSTTTSSKQQEMKFFSHGIGRERQTVSYDTVKDYIVQVIQKTYKNGQDTAVSIWDLKKKDLNPSQPTRGVATASDTAETLQQQKGMDTIYQAELERYLDRKYIGAKPDKSLCSDLQQFLQQDNAESHQGTSWLWDYDLRWPYWSAGQGQDADAWPYKG